MWHQADLRTWSSCQCCFAFVSSLYVCPILPCAGHEVQCRWQCSPSLPIFLDSNKIASLALCCRQLTQHHLTCGVAAAVTAWSSHVIWLRGFNGLISNKILSVSPQTKRCQKLSGRIVWSLLPGKAQGSAKQLARSRSVCSLGLGLSCGSWLPTMLGQKTCGSLGYLHLLVL